jgi:hypothetical protein
MRNLTPKLVLLFYDYPQVFIGMDCVDTLFICMAIEEADDGPVYVCTPISEKRRDLIVNGKMDLRSAFSQPEIEELYIAQPNGCTDESMSLKVADYSRMHNDILPESGLIFDCFDEVAIKAAELNTAVSYVSLGVPEASESARIKSTTLAGFLSVFQNAIKNLTKLAAKETNKKFAKDEESFCTDVFGFSMGSFTIHLRSSVESDIFGDNALLSKSLEKMNAFLALVDTPDQAILYLQSIKGHTASSLIKLLSFLSDNSCPIRHRWANPEMSTSNKSEVALQKIKGLAALCRNRSDLMIEEVTITGNFIGCDIGSTSWKIISEEDGKTYSGEIHPESSATMAGIIMKNARYKINCEELLEITSVTGKEVKRLRLRTFEKLPDKILTLPE